VKIIIPGEDDEPVRTSYCEYFSEKLPERDNCDEYVFKGYGLTIPGRRCCTCVYRKEED
jgi:hypothetical protein